MPPKPHGHITPPIHHTMFTKPRSALLYSATSTFNVSYLYTSKNYLESSALASFPVVCDFLKQQACMCTSLHFLQKVLCDSMGKESILNLCFSPFLHLHILSRFSHLHFFKFPATFPCVVVLKLTPVFGLQCFIHWWWYVAVWLLKRLCWSDILWLVKQKLLLLLHFLIYYVCQLHITVGYVIVNNTIV